MPMYEQMIELLLLSEHFFLGKDASLRIGGSASARRCGRIVMKTNPTSRHRHHVLCRNNIRFVNTLCLAIVVERGAPV